MIKIIMPNGMLAYKSLSGTYYQYDLSNPLDKQQYQSDFIAQNRDAVSLNLYRQSDNGGGIYENV